MFSPTFMLSLQDLSFKRKQTSKHMYILWSRYPEVAGSVPAQTQLFTTFKLDCNALLKNSLPYTDPMDAFMDPDFEISSRIPGS